MLPARCYSLAGDSPHMYKGCPHSVPWRWLCGRWFKPTCADLANGYQQHLCAALDSMDSGHPITAILLL
nr:MAG TPA: hypothetical protein [Caudoviricetes sp.]